MFRGAYNYTADQWLLLISTGAVTGVPLLWYVWGVEHCKLIEVGLWQYISPVLQFVIAIYLFHEHFSETRFVAFSLIWIALVLLAVQSVYLTIKSNILK